MPDIAQVEEIYSSEVHEIIEYAPSWLVRFGTVLLSALFLLLLIMSWLIHYPDIIKAPFKLTSVSAPKALYSNIDGEIVRLFVKDGERIVAGQVLAYLKSTADHDEVLDLEKALGELSKIKSLTNASNLRLSIHNYQNLGELQSAYLSFTKGYTDYISYIEKGYNLNKRTMLEKDLQELKNLEANLWEQKTFYAKASEIAEQEFHINEQLFHDKVIPLLENKREESKLIARKIPLKQVEAEIINNRSQQNEKLKELNELDKAINDAPLQFHQLLYSFQNEIKSWKYKFIITSNVSGKIYFPSTLEEKQFVSNKQELFYIDSGNEEYFGELKIPQYNFGKVRKDQLVIIKLNSYPYHEFGAIEGRIESISEVASKDSSFLAKVYMVNGLTTNFGKQIKYRSGINATGEIVTEDTRLIHRIFFNFYKAFDM